MGEITVTELLSDNELAISKERLAETTGSGGKTAEIRRILLKIVHQFYTIKRDIIDPINSFVEL